jgi:hypothetical protein
VYRTPLLAAYVTAELVIATVFCLASLPGLNTAFNLTDLPVEYRAKIFLLACCYSAAALLYERFCVPHVSDDEGERERGFCVLGVAGFGFAWYRRCCGLIPPPMSLTFPSPPPPQTPQSPCRPRWWGPSPSSARRRRRRPRRRQPAPPTTPMPGAFHFY